MPDLTRKGGHWNSRMQSLKMNMEVVVSLACSRAANVRVSKEIMRIKYFDVPMETLIYRSEVRNEEVFFGTIFTIETMHMLLAAGQDTIEFTGISNAKTVEMSIVGPKPSFEDFNNLHQAAKGDRILI